MLAEAFCCGFGQGAKRRTETIWGQGTRDARSQYNTIFAFLYYYGFCQYAWRRKETMWKGHIWEPQPWECAICVFNILRILPIRPARVHVLMEFRQASSCFSLNYGFYQYASPTPSPDLSDAFWVVATLWLTLANGIGRRLGGGAPEIDPGKLFNGGRRCPERAPAHIRTPPCKMFARNP